MFNHFWDVSVLRNFFSRLYALIVIVARRFWDDRGLQIASSLTFTTLLSLVPVATVALALMSAFPVFKGMSVTVQDWVFNNLMPQSAEALEKYSSQFIENAGNLTAVGLLFLAVTAVMLLLTIEDAFNDIWRVRRARPMLQRILIYWALITVGPLLMGASLTLSSWLMGASAGWTSDLPYVHAGLIKCSAIILTSQALSLLYYAMPTRAVQVKDALIGGALAGIAFELTKQGFGYYVTQFPTYSLVYGAFATIPVFLMWVFLSWLVVLLGAVVTAALPEWRQRTVQGRHAPGSNFMAALQILRTLWQAQRQSGAVTTPSLHATLQMRFERIESILESMHAAGWVNRGVNTGWVLARHLGTIAVADVYKRFVFDPDQHVTDSGAQPHWMTLARDFSARIGDGAQMSVANLFEAGESERADVASPRAADT